MLMKRYWYPALLAAVLGFSLAVAEPSLRAQEKPKPDEKSKSEGKPKTEEKPKTEPAAKVEEKPKATVKTAVLTVSLPREDAELKIDSQVMRTTGIVREFDVGDLDPKKNYEYELTVKFEPNNYTTITRKKLITFKGSDATISADLSKDDPADKIVIRYVATPNDIVKEMMKLGKVGKDDVVYDLGCGDGRIVVAAVRDSNAKRGVGIDLDPERVKDSKATVKEAKLEGKVEIRQGDILDIKDLSDASVVMIYMSDELGKLLEPTLKKGLKPGSRIVSHRFTLGNWKPEKTITVKGEDGDEYTLHLWVVPKP
jgi:uncharacterized protein (TIGR03000 family)